GERERTSFVVDPAALFRFITCKYNFVGRALRVERGHALGVVATGDRETGQCDRGPMVDDDAAGLRPAVAAVERGWAETEVALTDDRQVLADRGFAVAG